MAIELMIMASDLLLLFVPVVYESNRAARELRRFLANKKKRKLARFKVKTRLRSSHRGPLTPALKSLKRARKIITVTSIDIATQKLKIKFNNSTTRLAKLTTILCS